MENPKKKHLPNVTLIGVTCLDLLSIKIAADICEKYFSFGSVKILSSVKNDDPRIIPISHYNTLQNYSDFCIKELWKYVETDYAICFHPDGFILNPEAWDDNFLNYDYIGAPWFNRGSLHVGNGGFSLRSKRLLTFIGKNYQKIGGNFFPEDFWICSIARPFLEKEGMIFAPLEVAQRFSKEGNEHGIFWSGEFGWHGLNYTDISKWFDKNPEYKNKIIQNLDDFTVFMRKYPVYDGTFHVLQCKPIQVSNYKKLASGEKNYDCRLNLDIINFPEIKTGHKIIYKLFRISLEKVGVKTFERQVKKVEKFSSKKEFLEKYPNLDITPSFNLPKWRQRAIKIFGNLAYPENKSYTLIWFEVMENQSH